MRYILSLDPGVTTGICFAQYNEDEKRLNLKVGQLPFTHASLYSFLQQTYEEKFVLIYERFDYRNSYTGANLTPVEMIGVIKMFVEDNKVPSVYDQSPIIQSDTGYWSNDRLKLYGAYARGYEHGRSATKHLLYWWQFGPGFGIHQHPDFNNYKLSIMPKYL